MCDRVRPNAVCPAVMVDNLPTSQAAVDRYGDDFLTGFICPIEDIFYSLRIGAYTHAQGIL